MTSANKFAQSSFLKFQLIGKYIILEHLTLLNRISFNII